MSPRRRPTSPRPCPRSHRSTGRRLDRTATRGTRTRSEPVMFDELLLRLQRGFRYPEPLSECGLGAEDLAQVRCPSCRHLSPGSVLERVRHPLSRGWPSVTREGEVVEILGPEACRLQGVADRPVREGCVVLDPSESFLLDRGDQLTVDDQSRRGATLVHVDAQNVHTVRSVPSPFSESTSEHMPPATPHHSNRSTRSETNRLPVHLPGAPSIASLYTCSTSFTRGGQASLSAAPAVPL